MKKYSNILGLFPKIILLMLGNYFKKKVLEFFGCVKET